MTFPFNLGLSSAEKARRAAELAAADNLLMFHAAAYDMSAAEIASEVAVYLKNMDLPDLLALQKRVNDLVWEKQE